MEIFYHFDCEFPAVYLVNGVFFESLTKLKTQQSDSLYITALPLDAVYLPYTVRIGAGDVFANGALATLHKLKDNRYYVRLMPRFNYVYSPVKHERKIRGGSLVRRLFEAVEQKDIAAARALLTDELSASVDDNSLLEFFEGYTDLIDNNGYIPCGGESFFLIPETKESATLFKVEYRGGLIDNIGEV